ncbi:Fc.00g004530.m01.CDS01 [Cosmosporella sp. VM-42]
MDRYRLLEDHRPEAVTSWSYNCAPTTGTSIFTFNFPKLVLQVGISSDSQYLTICQVLDINRLVPRRQLDPVRDEVRQILQGVFGKKEGLVKEFDLEVAILQALERISELEDEPARGTNPIKPWAAGELSNWEDVLNNPYGLDVSTIRDTASEILGKTPEELVKNIPSAWRVIHMESVLRPDFVKRFRAYKEELRCSLKDHQGKLSDKLPPHSQLEGKVRAKLSRENIIEDMTTPRVTFHGTPLKSVASIVRYGFRLPGRVVDGKIVASPRSGVAFNRGIYSSQAPFYALSYAAGQHVVTPVGMLPSMRLFVCATVMGRTYRDQEGQLKVHGPLVEGYDSHFDGGFEYIVHDERAMLPCYVIHLDLGSAEAKKALDEAQRNPVQFYWNRPAKQKQGYTEKQKLAPGDLKRDREAKKAAAMKWFPYGFGPATGTRFVIEEVGDISDDEEEYGDWQADKHAFTNTHANLVVQEDESGTYDDWDEDGNPVKRKKGLFMDQYQHAIR